MKLVRYYAIKRRFKEARERIIKDFMEVKKGECSKYYFDESTKKVIKITDSVVKNKAIARIQFKRSPKDDGENYLILTFKAEDAIYKIDKDNTIESLLLRLWGE